MIDELHVTSPVLVFVDVDTRIAPVVAALNRIDGLRTRASCEATGHDWHPYVMVTWLTPGAAEALAALIARWHDAGNYLAAEYMASAQTVTLDDYRPQNASATLVIHREWLDRFIAFVEADLEVK